MLTKFPLSEITDEMLITPMIILFISIAKRGSSTTTWINRHGATLNAEHRFLVTDLTPETISDVWASLRGSVDDGNIEEILKFWASFLPGNSIRFRITLQHAVGSGLASLDVIHHAFVEAPTFPWAKLYTVIPGDFRAVQQAFMVVGDNQYFGYRAAKGLAASRLYRSPSWASSRILSYANPSMSSNNYAGGSVRPAQYDLIEEIITKWRAEVKVLIHADVSALDAQFLDGFMKTAISTYKPSEIPDELAVPNQ